MCLDLYQELKLGTCGKAEWNAQEIKYIGKCYNNHNIIIILNNHRPPVAGIHGSEQDGCYSIAMSGTGEYNDDLDWGESFTYTGEGIYLSLFPSIFALYLLKVLSFPSTHE